MSQAAATHNIAEYSVSEISGALKKVVEESFNHVRVRGEISGWRGAHASGHCYFALKDDKAKLDAIIWKGSFARIGFKPEEGMEVIATGKLTTYPGKSGYQITIETLEPAGVGALMALLEKRKKELAAEGLFDPARKRPLPLLPERIGIVTSPTGAVIRDILHRLADRFPREVLLWPVIVQGEGAAQQIAAAINGFNAMQDGPDLLIVARGGGSIEDLWCFNEEIVVRAAAASRIPLISAVGHETDTTLIDYAADRRAPTPTAAAEMAVPVRAELLLAVSEAAQRMARAQHQRLTRKTERLQGLARGLPRPAELLAQAGQRLDMAEERLATSLLTAQDKREQRLALLAARLPHPQHTLQQRIQQLSTLQHRLQAAASLKLSQAETRAHRLADRLQPAQLNQSLTRQQEKLERTAIGLQRITSQLDARQQRLESITRHLALLDYRNVLQRGYALVQNPEGRLVTNASEAARANRLKLIFADGQADATPLPKTAQASLF